MTSATTIIASTHQHCKTIQRNSRFSSLGKPLQKKIIKRETYKTEGKMGIELLKDCLDNNFRQVLSLLYMMTTTGSLLASLHYLFFD